MARLRTRTAALLVVSLVAVDLGALSTDREQPIHIEADWAEADDQEGTSVYKGDVLITQGSLRISGDTVTIYYNASRDLTRMIAVGQPARFQQLPDGETEYQRAEATQMEYLALKDRIVLSGTARSWQGKDALSGDRIVFDTVDGRILVQGEAPPGKTPQRVRITITPKKDCAESDESDCVSQ